MISSADTCRQLVAGNYEVILDDDDMATFKTVLTDFLHRFQHHENELLALAHQQQQMQPQHQLQQSPQSPLTSGCYVNEFKMLKELSRALKENTGNFIDGLQYYNQSKNRYKDIIPFNHTRVILSSIPQLEPGSNYINANFVGGPSGSPKSYIACQGPLPHTLNDFWRMIWECRVSVIVMACNEQEMGKSKCEQYWPDQVNGSQVYGNIRVTLMRVRQINSDFLVRKFSVQLFEPEEADNHYESETSPQTATTTDQQQQHQHQHMNEVQLEHNQAANDTNNNNNNNHMTTTSTAATTSPFNVNGTTTCAFSSNDGTTSSTSNESINTSDDSSEIHQRHHNNNNNNNNNHYHKMANGRARGAPTTNQTNRTSNRAVLMERTVCQFHFQGWQDHGVPDSVQSILELVRLIREVQPGYNSSILVHCSAGCGRTGTICCIDYVYGLMRMGKLKPNFSLFTIISEMRQQRMAMVQTIEQYILCYRAVAALFMQQLQLLGLNIKHKDHHGQIINGHPKESSETNRDEVPSDHSSGLQSGSKFHDTSSSSSATVTTSSYSKCSSFLEPQDEIDYDDVDDEEEEEDLGPVFI